MLLFGEMTKVTIGTEKQIIELWLKLIVISLEYIYVNIIIDILYEKNLPPSESKKELGYSYENYLLSYILKNFGEKIHDKFLQNVIRKL